MKLILTAAVDNLGVAGDVVEVKDGYGRNFLLPRGYAIAYNRGTAKQIEQLVRISREFGRPIATAKQAREICKIGVFYDTVEETLAANGFAPNRNGAQQGYLQKIAA